MPYIIGKITFDYSSHSGIRSIGSGKALFATKWSRAGGGSIHAYKDSVKAIAIAEGTSEIFNIRDAARFDYSSRSQHITEGQILLLQNSNDLYAAVKILSVQSGDHGGVDKLTFRFAILRDGSRNFSAISDIEVSDTSFSKRVLFIGAGFSRNWGGLLANEVAGRILNHEAVQGRPHLRDRLIENPSFEDVLEETKYGLFEEEDHVAIQEAISEVFSRMDEHYKNPTPRVLPSTINDFISKFCPGAVGIGTGYVFSLNQDLLLERIYGSIPNKQKLVIPGITWSMPAPTFPAGATDIPIANVLDPSGGNEPVLLRNFNLIKLHGSTNWRSTSGAPTMVMGRRKSYTISDNPLLAWKQQVFESVVSSGDVKMMIIGYGWGDDHINEIIAKAVLEHNLKLYTWSPQNPQDALRDKFMGEDILKGIIGYELRLLTEIIPHTPLNPQTPDYKAIVQSFFN